MFRYAGGNGQNIRVKNDVTRIYTGLFGQKTIGTPAYFYLPVIGVGLSVLVEGHHHYRRSMGMNVPCLIQELTLAMFQRDGVDNRFARNVVQGSLYYRELRGIDHPGHKKTPKDPNPIAAGTSSFPDWSPAYRHRH